MWNLREAGSKSDKMIKPLNDNQGEISFFDVKDLYEKAYAYKAKKTSDIAKFHLMMAKAQKMDNAYRAQLNLIQIMRHEKAA